MVVPLTTHLPPKDCARLTLSYQNPAELDLTAWKNREVEGLLDVPKAGKMLYRAKP
jgi:hypothetical protein